MNYQEKAPFRYPSPAEVKLYIGGVWIDDAYRIDYQVSTPRTPLYDYTSRFYKDVAEGHSVVQGQLIINYRFPNYLLHAIESKLYKDPGVLKDISESAEMFRDLLEGSSDDKIRKLIELKRLGALKPAKQVSRVLYSDNLGINGPDLPETDSLVISQKGIIPFDINISYSGSESLYTNILKNCILIGEGQVISASALAGGDLSASALPIYEAYNFFAQKVESQISTKIKNVYGRIEE